MDALKPNHERFFDPKDYEQQLPWNTPLGIN